MSALDRGERRAHPAPPPRGRSRLRWYGPGLLWMVSSVGSGAVLFTPRVGSRYGYELLWAAVLVVAFMWVMIREIGRYTVVTGRSILDGFDDIHPLAVWLIFVPQALAAVATVTGISALLGSILLVSVGGDQMWNAVAVVVASAALVISGRYRILENVASLLAFVLVGSVLVAAIVVAPSAADLGAGAVPRIPAGFDVDFVLPWLGFILAGAAGMMWFSYWVAARGYGGETELSDDAPGGSGEDRPDETEATARIRDWVRVMSTTAAIGVCGGGLVILAFLVLGAEVLRPEGIVPEGVDVAAQLTDLLSEVWGRAGFWILVTGMFVALAGTVLSNQDGWGRMLADATAMIVAPLRGRGGAAGAVARAGGHRGRMRTAYILVLTLAIPVAILVFIDSNPVGILSVAGAIAAIHTPIVVALTVWLCRRGLPRDLRMPTVWLVAMLVSAAFFGTFGAWHLASLVGIA